MPATREQLGQALKNADAAGDTEAAQKLAMAIREMDTAAPARPQVNEVAASPSPYTPDMIDSMYGKPNSGLMKGAGAFADRFVNSATFGNAANINAGLSKMGIGALDMGESFAETKANENVQRKSLSDAAPASGMAGDLTGFIAPGAAAYKLGAKVVSPIVRGVGAIAPKGAGAASRAVRYGGRLGGAAAEGAAQFGLYQGTVGASNKEMETGEAVGAGESLQMAKEGATDPLAWAAGPALSGIFRGAKYIKSGGRTFTPDAVARRVDAAMTPAASQVLDAEQFGVIEPQAEKLLFRLLGDAGYSRDDIVSAVNTFEQSIQGSDDLAMLPSRLKDVLVVKLGKGAEEAVDGFLQGAANRTGTQGAASVGAGVAEDAGRLSQFAKDSANNRFGSANRFTTSEAAKEEMARLGKEGYAPILNRPVADEDALGLIDIMTGPGMSKLREPLDTIAAGEGVDIATMMLDKPLAAAHWMQSKARMLAKSSDPAYRGAFGNLRRRLLNVIEDIAPDYKTVRQQYGDEFSNAEALTFGDRFISISNDEMKLGQMLKDLNEMTTAEREAAMLSIRDNLLGSMIRRTEGGAPRMTIAKQEPVLNALERLGPEGTAFANDVRTIVDRLNRNTRISASTGSNTMNKQQASDFAESAVSNKIVRTVGNALQNIGGDAAISGATGFLSPVMTGRAMIRGAGNALAKGRQGKIDKLTDLLMRDAGARPRPPMSGDGPVPTPAAAAPNALSQGVSTGNPVPASTPVSSAGASALRSDAGNALAGGMVGSAAPADSPEDRARNALIGAMGAGIAGRVGPRSAGAFGAGITGKPPKIKSDVPLGTRSRTRQPLPDVTGDTVEPNHRLVKVMSEPAKKSPPRKGDYNQKPLYTVRRQATDTPGDLQKGDRFPAEGLKKKQNPILEGQGDGDRQWVLLSDSASGAKKAFDRGQGMTKKNGHVQDVLYRGQAKTINVPGTVFGNGKRMRDLVQSAFDDGAGVVKLVFRDGREIYVAKDASVLRSPRAGFDPAKSGNKDIMAALPLIGGVGAVTAKQGNALATQPRDEKTGQFVAAEPR